MIKVTQIHGFTQTLNTENNKATEHSCQKNGEACVYFGRVCSFDGTFQVSHSKGERTYKTAAGAARAIKAWTK